MNIFQRIERALLVRPPGLDRKIRRNLMLFTFIPFIITVIIVSNNVYGSFKSRLSTEVGQSLKRVGDGINFDLGQVVEKSTLLISSKDFIPAMNRPDFSNDSAQLLDFQLLLETRFNPGTDQLQFILEGYTGLKGSYIESLQEQTTQDHSFIDEHVLKAGPSIAVWDPSIHQIGSHPYMTFYRNISPFSSYKGVLRMNVPYDTVTDALRTIEGAFPQVTFIHEKYKGNGAVVTEEVGKPPQSSSTIIASTLLMDGSRMIAIVHPGVYRDKLIQVIEWMLGAVIPVLLFVMLASRLTARHITRDFNRFVNMIRSNDSILLSESPIDIPRTHDDVFFIKQKFIDILQRLNSQYSDLMNARNANHRLEMELLQARLNPHLLYNTLSVIKWDALKRKDNRTAEIIGHMTKYYRIALKKNDLNVLVMKEIEMIDMYVRIISFTQGQLYRLSIEADSRIMSITLPKHLLQPIVENAVMHGLKGMDDAFLTVRLYEEGKDLVCQIEDNGRGMSEEAIQRILDPDYNPAYGGYGVKNVIKRLQLYNGDDRGVTIASQVGRGTTVTLRLKMAADIEMRED